VLAEGELYAGRRASSTVLQLDLDREAAALLRAFAGGTKSLGREVSRLIYEERARREERARLKQAEQPPLPATSAQERRASKAG